MLVPTMRKLDLLKMRQQFQNPLGFHRQVLYQFIPSPVAGVPDEKLMEAHGSFSTASCTLCGQRHDGDMVKEAIVTGKGPVLCESQKCKGKVKPDIVFFGENLPHTFWNFHEEVHFTDLLLVIGTSLEVYPFAGIADAVGRFTPRVLINRDVVGSFGSRIGDVILNGDLVEGIWNLAKEIGNSEFDFSVKIKSSKV
ncbi:NAD-dependent protein deacetylase hst2-1-like [Penaeus monodon]|uniref:NAD-dependent protein deacetylase hst2-1-like n=1 Tax=Penaeus monodon TaxID=6687 RepID=UPI0018A7BF2D|nr:NAD-dependent protein deacetylase hst2-1-like [Penaeus monodon]